MTGQLLDGFVKLNDFCQRVNEAPDDLLGLKARHANVTAAIDHCAALRKKDQLHPDDPFTKDALKVCEDELRILAELTASLTPEAGARWWKRKQKAVKTVFSDRTIENCKGRLEGARSRLMSARIESILRHQIDTGMVVRKVHHDVEDMKRSMSTRDPTMLLHVVNLEPALKHIGGRSSGLPPTDSNAATLERYLQTQSTKVMPGKVADSVYSPTPMSNQSHTPARQPYSRALSKRTTVQRHTESYLALVANVYCHYEHVQIDLGNEEDERDTSPWNVRNDYKSTFHVVPNWLPLAKGFSVSMLRTGQGWLPQVEFAFFNVRPYEAPIFEVCSRGDVEGVKRLLMGGEASPFDQDPDGWTPLHCAAQAHHYSLCKLLISQGANPNCTDSQRVSPLHLALSPRPHIHPLEAGDDAGGDDDVPRLVRLLVEFGGSDPSLENDDGCNCYDLISSYAYRWPVAVQLWLFRQTVFDFDPNHRDPQGLMTFMKVRFLLAAAPADLDALFDRVDDINATVELPDDHSHSYEAGWTILHIAVVHLLQRVACPVDAAARVDRVRYLLQRGADPHALSDRGETPTDIALRHVTLRLFNTWRDILCETGYNLREFVKAEIAVHSCVRWYAMNWCDYHLITLLELDDESKDELLDINTSGLFRSRDDTPLSIYDEMAVDPDFFVIPDDSDDDRPPLTISEKRRKRRAVIKKWRLTPRPMHQPGVSNIALEEIHWNARHEKADWILYGRG